MVLSKREMTEYTVDGQGVVTGAKRVERISPEANAKGRQKALVSNAERRERAMRERIVAMRAKPAAAENNQGEFRRIKIKDLTVPKEYQRRLTDADVWAIAEDFDWEKFHVLNVVARKTGELVYRDGQHRVMGAYLKFGGEQEVPCMVYRGNGIQHEAEVFNALNIRRRALNANDRWNSRLVAGEAPVLAINAILSDLKLTPALHSGVANLGPMRISCMRRLEKLLEWAGETSVRETLQMIALGMGDVSAAFKEAIVKGVWHFIIRYPQYRADRLTSVLKRHGPQALEREGLGLLAATTADDGIAIAVAIHRAYNLRLQTGVLPDFVLADSRARAGVQTRDAARRFVAARSR